MLEIERVRIGAVGPRAVTALGASESSKASELADCAAVVADNATLLADARLLVPKGVPTVALDALPASASVSALELKTTNPVGWKAQPGEAWIPENSPQSQGPSAAELRKAHHVIDWTGAGDAVDRAGKLAAAAATGAVISVDDESAEVGDFLGASLWNLMSDRGRIEQADAHEREALSVAMRREAMRGHSARARAGQVLDAAGVDLPVWPLVSVIVPTRRPERLADVVAAVEAQAYPRVELIVGLHGEGFDTAVLDRAAAAGVAVQAASVPARLSLGDVLNEAAAVSSGSLLAKMDDDDLYGTEHLWDLVLAQLYSGAGLVGKVSEYVWLAGTDCTVRRFAGLGERYIDPARSGVAGGTLLVRRDAFDSAGGWRSQDVGEDRSLAADVAAADVGGVYRTHGRGYLLVRHGVGHTWAEDDAYFLDQAVEQRQGCARSWAGVA